MPKQKGVGIGKTGRFNIRLDDETADFYRKEANYHGLEVSEYFRQMLMRGVIAESVQETKEDLKQIAAEIQEKLKNKSSTIPDEIVLSLFMVEALLKKVVGEKNIQSYYEAQNMAQSKLKQFKIKKDESV